MANETLPRRTTEGHPCGVTDATGGHVCALRAGHASGHQCACAPCWLKAQGLRLERVTSAQRTASTRRINRAREAGR